MSKRDRVHTPESIKAAAHPTRQTILRILKERDHSTIELERRSGESRYNLYHHLQKLQEVGLIGSRLSDGRAKTYFLADEGLTGEQFYQLDRTRVQDPRKLDQVLEALSEALGQEIPDPQQVKSVSVFVEYTDPKVG
jgi:DNA-binding transcriptional ArsR family regulator